MQNNSRIGVLILIACTSWTTIFAQVGQVKELLTFGQEIKTSSIPLIARVVHDPDEGKAPPPT